jgi:iron transport multicopper oxidase
MMWLTWVAFFFTLASPTFAGVTEVWWNLTYVESASPDGLYERRVIGVNGTWPCVSTTAVILMEIENIHFEIWF